MTFVAVLTSVGYRGPLVVKRESGHNRVGDVSDGLALLRRFVAPMN